MCVAGIRVGTRIEEELNHLWIGGEVRGVKRGPAVACATALDIDSELPAEELSHRIVVPAEHRDIDK